jgi:hypothetical protein
MTDLFARIKRSSLTAHFVVLLLCIASFVFSVIESRLRVDGEHWGLMFANAYDLAMGRIPYREFFIQYGFISTLIQAVPLKIFGNYAIIVGIITGVFYSANIYLSFILWKRIMSEWLAVLSAFMMFLVHAYAIYPWSNYISYTFLLVSVLLIVRDVKNNKLFFWGGVLLAISYLARQNLLPVIMPVYFYFAFIFINAEQESRKQIVHGILSFHIGFGIVIGIFLSYIIYVDALHDWYSQSFTILAFYENTFFGLKETIFNFIYGISFGIIYPTRDMRISLYTCIFICMIFYFFYLAIKSFRKKANDKERIMFLFCVVTLFGYLQALHIYQIFRLHNASSIGIGLLIVYFYHFVSNKKLWQMILFGATILLLVFYLGRSLLFTRTSDHPIPWDRSALLSGELKEPRNVDIFKGKLFSNQRRAYYENINQVLIEYESKCKFIINYTSDCYIPYISTRYLKVQRAPFYNKELSELIFQDEKSKIDEVIESGNAVIFADKVSQIPGNYSIIRKYDSLAWGWWVTQKTYVAVSRDKLSLIKKVPVAR